MKNEFKEFLIYKIIISSHLVANKLHPFALMAEALEAAMQAIHIGLSVTQVRRRLPKVMSL